MNGIGLDCGTATVKLAMLSQERELLWFKSSAHHGAAVQTVRALLGELLQADSNACGYPVMLTGSIGNRLLGQHRTSATIRITQQVPHKSCG